ncbi:12817_t:CDS:1, partial [Gigaspora margarita]
KKKLCLSKHNATTKFRPHTLTKKPKRYINKEEKRQIKVNEERERREDINEGFALLQELLEVLLPTTYYKRKLSKANLLKKGDTFSYLQLFGSISYTDPGSLLATSYIQSQENRLTQLAKELNCLQTTYFDLLAELKNVKM